jgi:hypothetical protein
MNRILQAEVILTLTADQARQLLEAAYELEIVVVGTDTRDALREQCAKQGVQL